MKAEIGPLKIISTTTSKFNSQLDFSLGFLLQESLLDGPAVN